jgi:cell division septation protein DedD
VRRSLLLVVSLLTSGATAGAQANDPLLTRVQQLVNGGNRDAARALADSALLVRTVGTTTYGDALYARAYATADPVAAERDYLRLSIEYPYAPRVEDALLMVAQLRQARGDRNGARATYERLVREYPKGPQVARSAYWAGRLALEDGDLGKGCSSLFVASERVSRDDVELRNQVEYLRRRCMMPAEPAPPQRDSAAPPAERPDSGQRDNAVERGEWSVQVAAFQRKRDADALASRLRARGFQVRVVGNRAPFRVRVGRYPSRADAVAAQGRMARGKVKGIVVEAEPR